MDGFSAEERFAFERDGYMLVPGLAPAGLVAELAAYTDRLLAAPVEPVEYEALTGYPGAPAADGPGGRTARRFLQAFDRDVLLRRWAADPGLLVRLRQILGPELFLSRAHHNCIMVKDPRYSTDTGWHQDIRYWRFDRPELVTVLLALSPASDENGGLRFLPGSHRKRLAEADFDARKFFRPESAAGRALLADARTIDMQPGDAVFFHCLTLHAGPRNRDGLPRKSLLFTFHGADVQPLAGTRSAALPEWQP